MADRKSTYMKHTPALLAMLILCMALTLSGCSDDNHPTSTPFSQINMSIQIGDEGTLDNTTPSVIVAVDAQALDDERTAANAKDKVGVRQLLEGGRIFLVERGTRVKFLENNAKAGSHVRILDGPHSEQDGWVPTIFFKKGPPTPAPVSTPSDVDNTPVTPASEDAQGKSDQSGFLADLEESSPNASIYVTDEESDAADVMHGDMRPGDKALRQMTQEGKGFVVAAHTRAACLAIDSWSFGERYAQVNILDGKQHGETGWVPVGIFHFGIFHSSSQKHPVNTVPTSKLRPQLPLGYAETARKEDRSRRSVDSRFSEQERRQVYQEIVQAEDAAEQDTYAQYPNPPDPPLSGAELDSYLADQEKLNETLDEKYHARVCREHGLTEGQLNAISEEGVEGHWPNPDVKPSY